VLSVQEVQRSPANASNPCTPRLPSRLHVAPPFSVAHDWTVVCGVAAVATVSARATSGATKATASS